jgi:hypothetical protein
MARLLHSTLGRHRGGEASGTSVTACECGGRYYLSVVMLTNTSLVSHTAGISATVANTAALEGTLRCGSARNSGGPGRSAPSR